MHLTGTPIWCDARRRRDVCFVSSADRVGRTGHGQLIGSPTTLALLGARGEGHLAVPLRRRFTLGTLRLELISSGRGLGAAALYVDIAGRTVVYAGAVRTSAGGFAEPAEVRACDALVVAAPFGEDHHAFPAVDDVATELVTWTRAQLARGTPAVLTVDTVLDGFEIAARLAAEGILVAGSRRLRDAAARLDGNAQVPPLRGIGRDVGAVIRIEGERAKPPADAFVTALVSGRALEGAAGHDAAFAWPFVAGRRQLLAWIEQTRARDVFVTGACAEAIATTLGPRARVIGPPRQMALFAP